MLLEGEEKLKKGGETRQGRVEPSAQGHGSEEEATDLSHAGSLENGVGDF